MNLSGKRTLGIAFAVIGIVLCFSVIKANAVEPGFYLRVGVGYSWSKDADFREDDPASNPFLFIVWPSSVGGDVLDDIGDSPIISAGFGYRFNEIFRTDITASYRWGFELDEMDLAGTAYQADIESTALMVNGYYDIPVDLGSFKPFVGAGIGMARNKLDNLAWDDGIASGSLPGGTETGFAWQLMLGAAVQINDRYAIEFGYRYYDAGEIKKDAGWDNAGMWYTGSATGDLQAHEAMIEFTYLFGKKKKPVPVAAEAPAAVVAAPPPESDSDGDGVVDSKDTCPDTPKGVTVSSSGCPLDSDGDGVYDYLDKCPDTPIDLKVDADGCPIPLKKVARIDLDIQFDTNEADIKARYYDRLKEVADFMATYPGTTAVIEGHTDSVGSAAYNLTLSQRRAESVRDYLIQNFNINPDRLTAKGFGEDRPVASNDTKEGRSKNRRIQAVFTAEKEIYQKR